MMQFKIFSLPLLGMLDSMFYVSKHMFFKHHFFSHMAMSGYCAYKVKVQ
jgi:hypothetical protein